MIAIRFLRVVFIVLFLVIQSGMFFTACDTSNNAKENSSSGDDDDNDANVPEDVWTDLTSGLMWQVRSTSQRLDWYSAIDHCDSLVYAGYDDWKLPSISELRSLIRGCPATEIGGECGVIDSCVILSICWDLYACSGCDWFEGPSEDGCYWPKEIKGSLLADPGCRCSFWSSSANPEYSYNSYGYDSWGMRFHGAWIVTASKDYEGCTLCVR